MPQWGASNKSSQAPKFKYSTNALTGTDSFNVDIILCDGTEGYQVPSGWVLRREGMGNRAGRVTYECIVAISNVNKADIDQYLTYLSDDDLDPLLDDNLDFVEIY